MKTHPYDNSPPEGVFLFAICNVLGVGVVRIRIMNAIVKVGMENIILL
jgi:hypothetical protein